MKNLEKIIYHLLVLLVRLLGKIPAGTGERLGSGLGRLLYACDRPRRKIALNNLAMAMPHLTPAQREAIASGVFQNMGLMLFEICRAWNMSNQELMDIFRIEGAEHFHQAFRQGRGVLVLTGHFGNWEFLNAVGGRTGYPVSVVYRPLDFKPLDRVLSEFRTRFGGRLIHSHKGMRRIVRDLKNQCAVGILLDQSVDWYEGVFVNFFGQRTCTNKGLALMARKTGAPVVPLFMIREKHGPTARFLPAVPMAQTADKTKDVEINTARYNAVYEDMVRRYPDQWFWVHRRWKIRPYSKWPREQGH